MYRLKTNLYVFSGPMTFLQISFPSILTAFFVTIFLLFIMLTFSWLRVDKKRICLFQSFCYWSTWLIGNSRTSRRTIQGWSCSKFQITHPITPWVVFYSVLLPLLIINKETVIVEVRMLFIWWQNKTWKLIQADPSKFFL